MTTVVRCSPLTADLWNVFIDNAVGVIASGNLQIVVQPKIPLAHLLFLFECAKVMPRIATSIVGLSAGESMLDLLARWYLAALELLFANDIVRDYREVFDSLDSLQGRLDATKTARSYYSGCIQFSCMFEQYDADNALNRILRGAAERIAADYLIDSDLRRRLRLVARRFIGVGSLRPGDQRAVTDRRTASYEPALVLAKLILSGRSLSVGAGAHRAQAFLLPTPFAVQEGLTKLLRDSLKGSTDVRAASISVGRGLTVNPDLFFQGFNAVADVKYKLSERHVNRADLYQVVAFADTLRTTRAAIVTFVELGKEVPRVTLFGDVTVTPLTWSADPTLPAGDAAVKLCEDVRNWLGSQPLPYSQRVRPRRPLIGG
jgi:5-methylcytosine-specific restriction enzyme subunit McrC